MKKTRRKRIAALLCAGLLSVLLPISLFGCGDTEPDGETVNIVCTAFPQYDWLRAIVGDSEGFALSLLVDNGSDLHSYQPTVADRVEIEECDILVTVGGESDAWAEKMAGDKSEALIIRLFEVPNVTLCEVSESEIVSEHIHTESHGEHGHEHDHDHDHDHGAYDEHMWLSLSNARVCVEYFKEVLAEAYPNDEKALAKRANEYISEINSLEREYKGLTDNEGQKRLIFADRFPFAYLTAELGIEYCAAFSGCSTENNADLSTVTRLAERVREWNVRYLFVTETSDGRLANGVIAAAGADGVEVLTVDSMQSVTRARMNAGENYLSIMRSNLGVLRKAFS